jgi:hypothetical protein
MGNRTGRIIEGAFNGHAATVVEDLGETLQVTVEIFGRTTSVKVRHAEFLADEDDPGEHLRARIVNDQERLSERQQFEFWHRLVETPEDEAIVEHAAYEAHCTTIREAAEARQEALLADFDDRFASLDRGEIRAVFENEKERWLAGAHALGQLKASWNAHPEALTAHSAINDRARERYRRAAQAADTNDYLSWRAEGWSAAEHDRLLSLAEADLAERRETLENRLRDEWGFDLPEELARLWLFLRSLQPAEQAALAEIELSGFGILDIFDRPDAEPAPELDLRVHGRFYRDPPEMLTFMHGGSDGLHFGLFFDDGVHSSGVVSYYNNDGFDLGRPCDTPLATVRLVLESAVSGGEAPHDALPRERDFRLRLLREAVLRFETSDRPEHGEAYDDLYTTHDSNKDRFHTLDGAGVLVQGPSAPPRLTFTEQDAAGKLRRQHILADDPVVLDWVAEARRRLAGGDAIEALCLGRDLHWLSCGVEAREDLACELLADAYRSLGRENLAAIVEAHRRHRALPTVGVLRPS